MKTVILILFIVSLCNAQKNAFPDDFVFGVGSAAYQVEGAWNESGKGENIWDYLTHTFSDSVENSDNGDVACDSYHKTESDVQLLVEMGVDFYRFSISWSRILPSGYINSINDAGVAYYNGLIDELLRYNITPLVTIYHWDLPQPLQEIGGWPNSILVDIYVDYANLLFSLFGDRVTDWITFNEPFQICFNGYSLGNLAPAYSQEGTGGYMCTFTLLIAHAKTYRLYQDQYKETQKGRIGITVHGVWPEAKTNSEADFTSTDLYLQFHLGMFLHPIFSEKGGFPPILRKRIDALSQKEGFAKSRLPIFSTKDKKLLRGSSDFMGLNHYTTFVCSAYKSEGTGPSYLSDVGAYFYIPNDWITARSGWVDIVPAGFRNLLKWIKDEYNNPEVIVTENGYPDDTGDLNDCNRVNYHNLYLEALLEAIHVDKCNVTGYSAWSFMDSFEWTKGYTEKFGLHYVDFNDEDRPRTPKMSSYVYQNIIETGIIDWTYTPKGFDICEFTVEY